MHEHSYRYRHPVDVRFADTDLQGHVYFSNYLVYCDEALSGYLAAIGHDWNALAARGMEFFFVDTGYRFHGSARFGDRLDVHAAIARIGNTSFTAQMGVWNGDTLLGNGHITAVMVEPQSRRPVPVPASMREAVARWDAQH